jgi:hypothetical protein
MYTSTVISGHFDNFSCWQFGSENENSAHKEGLRTMIEEIEFLSKELTTQGHIKVWRGALFRGSGP